MAKESVFTVSMFGATLPIPRWTTGWIGALVVVGLAGLIVTSLLPRRNVDLVTLRQANAQMELEVQEYGRHMADVPTTTYDDADGVFTIKTFSDHCVVILRRVAGNQVLTRLVPDLTLDRQKAAAITPSPTASSPSAPSSLAALLDRIEPVVEAEGRCLDPHPGKFKTWNGTRNGCWLQVWRQFEDGCTHYQMLNTCNGAWESTSNGAPRVNWTACRH